MPRTVSGADYKPGHEGDKAASGKPAESAEARPVATTPTAPAWRPPDLSAVQETLQLLARAVHQFHTYPATSPLCEEAIATCRKALAALGRDQIAFRVGPRDLVVDEIAVGAGTVIEHELVRRLHRAQVASLSVDIGASPRDLSRFCLDLNRSADSSAREPLADLLLEHGVSAVEVHAIPKPELMDVGAPSAPARSLVSHEHTRRQTWMASGPVQHLYPPDKGWIRMDPGAALDTVTLTDLAILVDDPSDLAGLLLRLTGDASESGISRDAAIEQKYKDVATIFSAVEPRVARVLFARLARAVLSLETGRRKALLKRTILPGLLDGKIDGAVLSDFPDIDLADALCLLLDLEAAAPQVLASALDRLGLSAERRAAVVPLIQASAARAASDAGTGSYEGLDRYARTLLKVDSQASRSFAEFAAFDLSLDDQAAASLERLKTDVAGTDDQTVVLECLHQLVRLEPNPSTVEGFLRRGLRLMAQLEGAGRWSDLASWIGALRQTATAHREARPDVAAVIDESLASFCTVDRALLLARLHAAEESRAAARTLVEALGPALAAPIVTALGNGATSDRSRHVMSLLSDHASTLAPGLARLVPTSTGAAARAIIKALGIAGPGYETALAKLLPEADEATGREALRALAKMGSAQASAILAEQLRDGVAWARGAAEEALWHLPAHRAAGQVRELLARKAFVLRYPQCAARLLDRAAQTRTAGLDHALEALTPLRFRFWNPALVRVGLKAKQLLRH